MATTLETLAKNSTNKLVQGFINELITDSFFLASMPFDNCMTANGTSDLIYGYKRVKTPATAAFRALNSEPEKSEVEIDPITTSPGILSSAWDMDRVAKAAAEDIYELKVTESKNAIIRKFNATVINGDKTVEELGFDGLSKALTGSNTEFTSAVNLAATLTEDVCMAFAEEMDTLLSKLTRTPDAIAVSPTMAVKINSICRKLGINNITTDTVGHRVASWDGIRIEQLRDGALTVNDVYAICFGIDEFHGITLIDDAVTVNLPDWSTPGAVKTGDSELVCGCALKATKAAGVLRAFGSTVPEG